MVIVKNCDKMFWGVTIDAGKRYTQVVKQGFHVSMAALELNKKGPKENVQVMLQHESSEIYLLCTLHNNQLQQPLDLNFATGEEVAFSLNGSGVVHLTGYLIPEDDFEEDFSGSDEDDEIPSLVETTEDDMSFMTSGGKRKALVHMKKSKKLKLMEDAEDDSEDDEMDSDSEEEEDFSDDFEGDSDFDEEDSEVEDEIIASAKKGKKDKTPGKSPQKNTPVAQKSKGSTPQKEVQTPKKEGKSPKQQGGTPQQAAGSPATPANGETESAKKKKKKKKKKNKDGDKSLNESADSTPNQTPNKADSGTPKKRVVSGGTIVEDIKVGHGPEAKPGKMVSVYYVGTLAKNTKRFDSCTSGKPFRFRLNQGEVIKGWDTGVNGMKVGGKRKLTVPANQAYGNVKQGPIPPNSSLVFEVELKAVS